MERHMRSAVVILLWFLFQGNTEVSFCAGNPSRVICRGREKRALLSFRSHVSDPLNRLSSWTGEECCVWDRVGCDNITGHVVKLNLRYSDDLAVLGENKLHGVISNSLLDLKHLRCLDLSGNYFGGSQIPQFFASLVTLRYLNLANAGFAGPIPTQLGNLSNLQHLDIKGNSLNVEDLEWVGNLTSLQVLDMSGVNIRKAANWLEISGNMPKSLPLSSRINLGSNRRIEGAYSLTYLDLSGNLLAGELPDCWSYWTKLLVLKLGDNNLTGNIPSSMGNLISLGSLHLRNNHLSGVLPTSLQNCKNLVVLDLSENQFTGSLPRWIGKLGEKYLTGYTIFRLRILALRSNKFDGNIPQEFCRLESLQILDLADNNISGSIPRCFGSLLAMAYPNSEEPFFHSDYWTAEFREAMVVVIKGRKLVFRAILSMVVSMDLSYNNLSGNIPEELTSLHVLISLNLSQNHLEGNIPHEIRLLQGLESLDLSMNKLSGVIPQSVESLGFLIFLNLSYNDFSGRIPSRCQFATFERESYIGNHKLCGYPLPDACAGDNAPEGPIMADEDHTCYRGDELIENHGFHEDKEDKDGWIDMKWFYMGMPLGFVVGFWAVFGPLAFNRAWRYAFFGFLDDIKYKLLGL
ncbi:receptor-like protein EIX1 [Vitis riparia]|uniref:receptor-like protein EIX1 n=1 Tax=Vitis riparia TaxID=96939 RepID=UPI00155A303D|nr:receptor-like protein EIX1 [Vitis riparia]